MGPRTKINIHHEKKVIKEKIKFYIERKNILYHKFKLKKTMRNCYFNNTVCEFVNQLLRKNYKEIIGYKLYKNKIIIATNCVFDKNYMDFIDNKEEIKKYFLFYNYTSVPYFLDDVVDMLAINNDDGFVKTTDKSEIITFSQIKKK